MEGTTAPASAPQGISAPYIAYSLRSNAERPGESLRCRSPLVTEQQPSSSLPVHPLAGGSASWALLATEILMWVEEENYLGWSVWDALSAAVQNGELPSWQSRNPRNDGALLSCCCSPEDPKAPFKDSGIRFWLEVRPLPLHSKWAFPRTRRTHKTKKRIWLIRHLIWCLFVVDIIFHCLQPVFPVFTQANNRKGNQSQAVQIWPKGWGFAIIFNHLSILWKPKTDACIWLFIILLLLLWPTGGTNSSSYPGQKKRVQT